MKWVYVLSAYRSAWYIVKTNDIWADGDIIYWLLTLICSLFFLANRTMLCQDQTWKSCSTLPEISLACVPVWSMKYKGVSAEGVLL